MKIAVVICFTALLITTEICCTCMQIELNREEQLLDHAERLMRPSLVEPNDTPQHL